MRTHAHAHLAQRAHALLEDALEELLEDLWAKGSGRILYIVPRKLTCPLDDATRRAAMQRACCNTP